MAVLVIGDSHVGGLARYLQQRVSGVVPSYKDGSITRQWTNFNVPGPGDTIVVVLGTNDIFAGRPVSETASAARAIVQRAGGRRVIWALPPYYSNDRGTSAAIRASGAEIIDNLNLPMRPDRHPTDAGYRTWADAIVARLGASSHLGLSTTYQGATFLEGDSSRLLPIALIVLFGVLILRG